MRPEPIDVTAVMDAEMDLMRALKEWASAGAPAVDVISAVSSLVDAKLDLALRRYTKTVDRSDDI